LVFRGYRFDDGVKGSCTESPLEGVDRVCQGQARRIVTVLDLFLLSAGTVPLWCLMLEEEEGSHNMIVGLFH
jgi:hypothetical protein